MFYTDYASYGYIPSLEVLKEINTKNKYKIVVIDDGNLPDYILKDNEIIIIKDIN